MRINHVPASYDDRHDRHRSVPALACGALCCRNPDTPTTHARCGPVVGRRVQPRRARRASSCYVVLDQVLCSVITKRKTGSGQHPICRVPIGSISLIVQDHMIDSGATKSPSWVMHNPIRLAGARYVPRLRLPAGTDIGRPPEEAFAFELRKVSLDRLSGSPVNNIGGYARRTIEENTQLPEPFRPPIGPLQFEVSNTSMRREPGSYTLDQGFVAGHR